MGQRQREIIVVADANGNAQAGVGGVGFLIRPIAIGGDGSARSPGAYPVRVVLDDDFSSPYVIVGAEARYLESPFRQLQIVGATPGKAFQVIAFASHHEGLTDAPAAASAGGWTEVFNATVTNAMIGGQWNTKDGQPDGAQPFIFGSQGANAPAQATSGHLYTPAAGHTDWNTGILPIDVTAFSRIEVTSTIDVLTWRTGGGSGNWDLGVQFCDSGAAKAPELEFVNLTGMDLSGALAAYLVAGGNSRGNDQTYRAYRSIAPRFVRLALNLGIVKGSGPLTMNIKMRGKA